MGVMSDNLWAVGASGKSNLETGAAMEKDMRMRIASMTKSFTAVLVLKLVDEGLISLDDTLEKWLPGVVEQSDKITVHMLLNHTAGIHDHQSTPELVDSMLHQSEREWSQDEVLALIGSYPLDFAPGTSYSYSNAGYYILGVIIERAAGMTVQEALEHYIFKKQEIENTEIIAGALGGSPTQFYCIPFDSTTLENVTSWNLSWNFTAGAGVTTASDMLHFLDAVFVEDTLSEPLKNLMVTPQSPATAYGYGMEVKTYRGKLVVSHGGANPGNVGTWAFIPEINAGFFIDFNRLDLGDPTPIANRMHEVIDRVADLLIAEAEANQP